ncbi:MAG: hypothetical protein HYX24_00530 [Candidatus Aenigmarchaeota archaeon]|nr:hypothetical protein [Candidatus Aenigmarchaeota archaeon]
MMVYKVVAMTVIALVGVLVFLGIVSALQPAFMTKATCSAYQGALAVMPFPKEAKPSLPSFCYPDVCTIQRFRLDEKANPPVKSKDDVNRRLADLALQCWKCSDSGKKANTITCFDGYSIFPADEKGITKEIEAKGKCDFLPNSFLEYESQNYSCGTGNKLYFNSQEREIREYIVIKYDAFAHRIVIS